MTTAVAPAPRSGLRDRIMKAGIWILAGQLLGNVIRLATNVILTRLLFPDAFGLMSVVNILIMALGLFSDIGIARSLVQSPRGRDPAMLDTAWTLQVIRGQLLAICCLLGAIVFALLAHLGISRPGTVYTDPRLPWMVGGFAIVPAISGFDSVRNGIAYREMRQQILIKLDLGAQVAASLIMIGFALTTRSVWTLLVGSISSATIRCVIGYIFLSGHRERLRIEPAALRELMSHGKWVFISSILTFACFNGDRIFLGGIVDARQYGLYVIAVLIVSVPQSLATVLGHNVVYPAVSEVYRERPEGSSAVIARLQLGYDAIATTLFALLVTAGPAVVELIYDARYRDAGWMMSILGAGLIGARYQVVEQCYQAVGATQFMTLANFLRLVALVVGMLVGQRLGGLRGILVGVALSQFAAWPLAIWFKLRHGLWNWRAEAAFVPALMLGLGGGWLLSRGLHALFPWRVL